MNTAWQAPLESPLPTLVRRIALPDMVAYAGATWDWHRLHYDQDYARAQGLPAPVVDGQVLGALLAEQVLDWTGPTAWVRSLTFRLRAPVFAGDTVRCTGLLTHRDDDHLVVEQEIAVVGDGRIVARPARTEVTRR